MIQSVKLKCFLSCCCLIEILNPAASFFISRSLPNHNGFDSNLRSDAGVEHNIRHISQGPLSTLVIRKMGMSSKTTVNSAGNNPSEIPIIGPLLNIQKPIIVGESIWLDPPTPLQWKAVEASVSAQHGGTIMSWKSMASSENYDTTTDQLNLATIDKSPLVAVLHSEGKEYATIAAIEGIVTKKDETVDTGDAENFQTLLARLSSPYYSDSSKIRLMAIGRAKVSHFTTRYLIDDGIIENNENKDINDSEPLLVARMELLLDSNSEGETTSSPVHALNRFSKFSQRVRLLQEDRQRIVRGLQAAQSRLEMAMDNWKDWDGIGSISSGLERTEIINDDDQTTVLDQFLHEFNADDNLSSMPAHSVPISPGAARCIELDNFGFGTTSSAFVCLTSSTDVLMEKLKNYYSPIQVQSEEFEYEVFSWCALQSLQHYMSSREICEALYECTNTCARLEILYHSMIKHKMDLNELAKSKSLELRNCGEECNLF